MQMLSKTEFMNYFVYREIASAAASDAPAGGSALSVLFRVRMEIREEEFNRQKQADFRKDIAFRIGVKPAQVAIEESVPQTGGGLVVSAKITKMASYAAAALVAEQLGDASGPMAVEGVRIWPPKPKQKTKAELEVEAIQARLAAYMKEGEEEDSQVVAGTEPTFDDRISSLSVSFVTHLNLPGVAG